MPNYKQLYVGGAWKKEGYLSASFDLEKAGLGTGKVNFIIVENDKKDKETHPDYVFKMKNPAYQPEASVKDRQVEPETESPF